MVEFLRTLEVESDGDIARDEQDKTTFIGGVAGVKQELLITLSTVEGEQPFAPDFGLDVFEVAGSSAQVLRREIRLALRDDDRVQSIDDVIVEDFDEENRSAEVTVNITLVDATNIQLSEVRI